MVRLKGITPDFRSVYITFQFHYGTIKSFDNSNAALFCAYFNSIMVRLKVGLQAQRQTQIYNFNSIMVRLKETRR